MALHYSITPEGDSALVVRLGDAISPSLTRLVHAARARLACELTRGVTDVIGAYCTVMVCYDPLVIGYAEVGAQIGAALRNLDACDEQAGRVVEVPVCYGGDLGPDLADVAAHAGLTPDEVVRLHAAGRYQVCMLGFLPGFAYLEGLDPRLATPRLATPRTEVPAGAIGIGGAQAGMYPIASPGGWRIIGRTPARLYDPGREDPIPYGPGDELRFFEIGHERFDELDRLARAGEDVLVTRRQ